MKSTSYYWVTLGGGLPFWSPVSFVTCSLTEGLLPSRFSEILKTDRNKPLTISDPGRHVKGNKLKGFLYKKLTPYTKDKVVR